MALLICSSELDAFLLLRVDSTDANAGDDVPRSASLSSWSPDKDAASDAMSAGLHDDNEIVS